MYAVLLLALLVGCLAQVTGLCLVRGVNDLMNGHPLRILAIVSSGFWLCLYLPLVDDSTISELLVRHAFHWSYLAGGLIFGLGAAVNGSCTISTVTRLSKGDLAMIFTMIGWLAGWILWESTGIRYVTQVLEQPHPVFVWLPVFALVIMTVTFHLAYSIHWSLWNGIMLVGVAAGGLFILQPEWPPSNLLRDTGLSLYHQSMTGLPSLERILIVVAMLLGMSFGATYYGKFKFQFVNFVTAGKHLAAGALMGWGASLSLGGNDIQILLGLPALSPAGFAAIFGMVAGVYIGLLVTNNSISIRAIPIR